MLRPGGHRVTCVDIDEAKVAMLSCGQVPIYEPQLDDLIADGRRRKRLYFASDYAAAVTGADIVFIASEPLHARAMAMPISPKSTQQLKTSFRS
jgi:UDP-glucose 6-dehydrogenase